MRSCRPLSTADYLTLARLRHALREVERRSDDAARAAGLSPAQHELLVAVKGHPGPGPPSVSDLARVLRLRLHSALELINRAEECGLIARLGDPYDGRRHLVSLTPLGDGRLKELSAVHRDELRRLATEVAFLHDAEQRDR